MDFIRTFDYTVGNCFTFNGNTSKYMGNLYAGRRAGQGQGKEVGELINHRVPGFQAYLQTHQYQQASEGATGWNTSADYVPWASQAGFRVYIHLPNQNVYSESVGFSVAPGYHSTIGLRYVCRKSILKINIFCSRNTSTWARHTMIASRAMESPAIVCCRKACTARRPRTIIRMITTNRCVRRLFPQFPLLVQGCIRSCYQDTLMADPTVGCYDPRYPRPYYDTTRTPITNMLNIKDERIGFPTCSLAQRELMAKPDLGFATHHRMMLV